MLDSVDLQIINKLNRNGRISLTELAEDIKLSRVAIANRIEKLIQNNILRVRTSMNLEKLAYNTLIVRLQVEKQNMGKIKAIVRACPKVVMSLEMTGNHNVLLICADKNSTGLRDFIEHVLKPHAKECKVSLASTPFAPKFVSIRTVSCESCEHKEDCNHGI
jgi:DNA-binding Lrp family transcriptional regulator